MRETRRWRCQGSLALACNLWAPPLQPSGKLPSQFHTRNTLICSKLPTVSGVQALMITIPTLKSITSIMSKLIIRIDFLF